MVPSKISAPMRDILIEHIDGPVELGAPPPKNSVFGIQIGYTQRRQNLMIAMRAGLIEKVSDTATGLTEKGRMSLCAMLAHMADVLVRAGYQFRSKPEIVDKLADRLKTAAEKPAG